MSDTIREIRQRLYEEKLYREEGLLMCEGDCGKYRHCEQEGAMIGNDFICFECSPRCENLIGTGEYLLGEYYRPIEIQKRCPGRIDLLTKDAGKCDTCGSFAIYDERFKYYVPEYEWDLLPCLRLLCVRAA